MCVYTYKCYNFKPRYDKKTCGDQISRDLEADKTIDFLHNVYSFIVNMINM